MTSQAWGTLALCLIVGPLLIAMLGWLWIMLTIWTSLQAAVLIGAVVYVSLIVYCLKRAYELGLKRGL